jgi:hypothetical protein
VNTICLLPIPLDIELVHLHNLFSFHEVRNLKVVLLHELVDVSFGVDQVSFGVDEGDVTSLKEVRELALLAHGK